MDKITKVWKYKGYIFITFKGENNNGDTDTLYTNFTPNEPLYPLAEMLLEKYEKKAEFERLLKKAKKDIELAPITPLTKGE